MQTSRPLLTVLAVALLAAGGVLGLALAIAGPLAGPRATGMAGPSGETDATAIPEAPTGTASAGRTATSGAPGSASAVSLPAAIASIGDSLAVAFDADGRFGPAPEHSWVVGTDPNDGVDSHLERLRAMGDTSILVIDAARAGARIADGVRQATAVVRGLDASGVSGGAYVTFELGANDVCGPPPGGATSAARFREALRAALEILRDGVTVDGRHISGLPAGSRLLLLSVPDVLRLRSTMATVPAAQAMYARYGICSAVLSTARTASDLDAVARTLAAYDRAIRDACAGIEKTDGPSGRLRCRTDQSSSPGGSLAGAPFTPEDISALDYFHPSLRGQARIAEGAWKAGYWAADAAP